MLDCTKADKLTHSLITDDQLDTVHADVLREVPAATHMVLCVCVCVCACVQ